MRTSACFSSRFIKVVTTLTELKENKKYLLNKGKVKDKSILKAISKRVERLRKFVKNGMGLEKVRAFFNRFRKGRDGPPEKLPGAPPPLPLYPANSQRPGGRAKYLICSGASGIIEPESLNGRRKQNGKNNLCRA